jgi:hypothetical protein
MEDIYDKVNADYYKPAPRPTPPAKKCPKCNASFGLSFRSGIPNFCSICGTELNKYYSDLYSAYKKELKNHNTISRKLEMDFERDAKAYADITGHPKADRCFSLAWEYGHSDGLSSVLDYLDELSELL